jgi:hypothetical protein
MQLQAGRVQSMVADAISADTAIVCHNTLGTKQNAVCRGFFNRYRDQVAPLRLAVLVGAVWYQRPTRRPGG